MEELNAQCTHTNGLLMNGRTKRYETLQKKQPAAAMEQTIRQYTEAVCAARHAEEKVKQDAMIEARDKVRAVMKLVELETRDYETVQQLDGECVAQSNFIP